MHPRSHGTADLYHSAQLIVNYVFTVLKKNTTVAQQCSCTLGYMDVPRLQRHRFVGFVHCGSTFQTPTHYGTNYCMVQITVMYSPRAPVPSVLPLATIIPLTLLGNALNKGLCKLPSAAVVLIMSWCTCANGSLVWLCVCLSVTGISVPLVKFKS